MTKTILVSACLMGTPCRYDGTANEVPGLMEMLKNYQAVSFCPETLAGLAVPLPPAEIRGGDGVQVLAGTAQVRNQMGQDLTAEFLKGARLALELARLHKPVMVLAKAKSPSCGVGRIYDGNFHGKLIRGDGVTVALLRQAGFAVFSEEDFMERTGQILGEKNG